MEKMEGGILRK